MPLCDNEDGNYAVSLVSNTQNGDTLAMCGPCLVGWARIILEGTGATVTDPPEPEPSAPTVPPPPPPSPGDGDEDGDEDAEARGFSPGTVAAALGDLPPEGGEAGSTEQPEASEPATPPAGELADAPPY